MLSRPVQAQIGPPPASLDGVDVRIPVAGEGFVAGWFARGAPGRGAVLLLHGVRSNRTQMLKRAIHLHDLGMAVLLIDLASHGESSGDRITFGARESRGVQAALDHLQAALPGERIGVIGVSLGAASFVLAQPRVRPSAVVLESMFPTIEEAVQDRLSMRLGVLGASLEPLLLWQLPLRTGVEPRALRPIEHVARIGAPVLIAAGTLDERTHWAETRRLYAAARAPKQLWAVQGAAHVDLCAFDPAGYWQHVLPFLERHLVADAVSR
jgi:fermentation-respiration switch protein FrsA (DUF1100 family)